MLLRHYEDMNKFQMENMRGGIGTVEVVHMLNPDEMKGKGRLFAENIMPPGSSIGLHPHIGDTEAYYFLEGSGLYQNNKETYEVKAGDITVVDDGDMHGITNTGDVPLRFIALILFTGEKK